MNGTDASHQRSVDPKEAIYHKVEGRGYLDRGAHRCQLRDPAVSMVRFYQKASTQVALARCGQRHGCAPRRRLPASLSGGTPLDLTSLPNSRFDDPGNERVRYGLRQRELKITLGSGVSGKEQPQ